MISYPSYLFFNSRGELVHRSTAYQTISEFIATAEKALNPGNVYENPLSKFYQLLKEYKSGEKNYELMPYMIEKGIEALEDDNVEVLIKDYYTWLLTQPKEKIYTKENLKQIAKFTKSSSGKYFHLFFPNGKEADKVMGNSFFLLI